MDFVKNQVINLEITDISHEGEGVGKVDGFTFFVKDTIPGDQVTAKVMKTKKTYGYARLEQIITPSADRVEPICPHYKACGGCQLQAMSYERQLLFKQNKVYTIIKIVIHLGVNRPRLFGTKHQTVHCKFQTARISPITPVCVKHT